MASEDARKLFVAGLPDSVTEEVLRGLFSETGTHVTELTLPRDRMSGRPRGFAFVRLESTEDAERARKDLDGRIVDGRSISVRPFQTEPPKGRDASAGGERPERGDRGDRGDRSERPPRRDGGGPAPDRTLYVGNLPYDASPEEVEAMLNGYGVESVVRVHLPVDPDGRKRGFGFVTLGSADGAKNATELLKGAEMRGRRLIINLAHPKGSAPGGGDASGERPPRSFDGPPRGGPPSHGGGGGGGRFSGAPPFGGGGAPAGGGGRFGGPPSAFGGAPPSARGGDQRRKRKFDGDGEGGRGKARREHDERWRDDDDE